VGGASAHRRRLLFFFALGSPPVGPVRSRIKTLVPKSPQEGSIGTPDKVPMKLKASTQIGLGLCHHYPYLAIVVYSYCTNRFEHHTVAVFSLGGATAR